MIIQSEPSDTVTYIGTMARGLTDIAGRHGHEFLAYLLSMVAVEAARVEHDHKTEQRQKQVA